MNIKEIIKLFESFRYKYDLDNVFYDFLVFASSTFAAETPGNKCEKRLKKFYEIQEKYAKEEIVTFVNIMAKVFKAINTNKTDVLGEIYMQLGLGKKRKGQFFTPYCVSKTVAQMSVEPNQVRELIKEKGYVTMNEPSVGAGGMCIAFCEILEEENIDYKNKCIIVAQDIDQMCVMMTYIQLTMIGAPAIVHRGDSLANKVIETWYTPGYINSESCKKLTENNISNKESKKYKRRAS